MSIEVLPEARELSREEARAKYQSAAPTGLFSLADTLGCPDDLSDDTRSHASFYAVGPDARKEWRGLWRVFCAVFGRRFA